MIDLTDTDRERAEAFVRNDMHALSDLVSELLAEVRRLRTLCPHDDPPTFDEPVDFICSDCGGHVVGIAHACYQMDSDWWDPLVLDGQPVEA